jgi:hypothetical protein
MNLRYPTVIDRTVHISDVRGQRLVPLLLNELIRTFDLKIFQKN